MAFTGITLVTSTDNKTEATNIIIAGSNFTAGDTLLVAWVHDNLGDSTAAGVSVMYGGHAGWWENYLDSYMDPDAKSGISASGPYGAADSYIGNVATSGSQGFTMATGVACGIYVSTTSEDIEVIFPAAAKSKAVAVYKVSHTYGGNIVPVFRKPVSAGYVNGLATNNYDSDEYDSSVEGMAGDNLGIAKEDQLMFSVCAIEQSGETFTPNTPAGAVYQGEYGTTSQGASGNRIMNVFTGLGSGMASEAYWISDYNDPAAGTLSITVDLMIAKELYIDYSRYTNTDDFFIESYVSKAYWLEDSGKWGESTSALVDESSAHPSSLTLSRSSSVPVLGGLAVLNVSGSSTLPVPVGMSSQWTLVFSDTTSNPPSYIHTFIAPIEVFEDVVVAVNGGAKDCTAHLVYSDRPALDILGDFNWSVIDTLSGTLLTSPTTTTAIVDLNPAIGNDNQLGVMTAAIPYDASSASASDSGGATMEYNRVFTGESFGNDIESFIALFAYPPATTGNTTISPHIYRSGTPTITGTYGGISLSLITDALTVEVGEDVLIEITNPFDVTVTLQPDFRVAEHHEAAAALNTSAIIDAVPDFALLMTTSWVFETQENDENTGTQLADPRRQYAADLINNQDVRIRARFLIHNNTAAPISNFSPQLEVSLNNGVWEHCQDPGRTSLGLIARPYLGAYSSGSVGARSTRSISGNGTVTGVKPNRVMGYTSGYPVIGGGSWDEAEWKWQSGASIVYENTPGGGVGDEGGIGASMQRVFLSNKTGEPIHDGGHDLLNDYMSIDGSTWSDEGADLDGAPYSDLYASENGTIWWPHIVGSVIIISWRNGNSWDDIITYTGGTNAALYGQHPGPTDEIYILQIAEITGTIQLQLAHVTTAGFTLKLDIPYVDISQPWLYTHAHTDQSNYAEYKYKNDTSGLIEYYIYDGDLDTTIELDGLNIVPSMTAFDDGDQELYIKNNSNYSGYGIDYSNPEGHHLYKMCRYDTTHKNQVVYVDVQQLDFPVSDYSNQYITTTINPDRTITNYQTAHWHEPAGGSSYIIHAGITGVPAFAHKFYDRQPTTQQLGTGTYATVNSGFLSWGSSDSTMGTIEAGEEVEVVIDLALEKAKFDAGEPGGLFKLRLTDFNGVLPDLLVPAELLVDLDADVIATATLSSSASIIADGRVTTQYGEATLSTTTSLEGLPYEPRWDTPFTVSINSTVVADATHILSPSSAFMFTWADLIGDGTIISAIIHEGQATLSTLADITAAGTIVSVTDVEGAAVLDITTSFTATAYYAIGGYVFIWSPSTLVGTASCDRTTSAELNTNAYVEANNILERTISATFNQGSDLFVFSSSLETVGSSTLAASANISAVGQIEKYGQSALATNSTLTSSAQKGLEGAGQFYTHADFSGSASRDRFVSGVFNSSAELNSDGVLFKTGSAIMQVSAAVNSQADKQSIALADLYTNTQILALISGEITGSALLQTYAYMDADLSYNDNRDIIPFELSINRIEEITFDIN